MGEFRDTMQNQNIILYKLAQKHLDDDDILCEDDDNNISNNNKKINDNIINKKNKIFKKNFFHKKVKKKNSDIFCFEKDLFFPIDYEIVYNGISEFYYPFLKNILSTEMILNNSQNILTRLENYINSNSIFLPLNHENYSDSYIEFLIKQKENEEIILTIFIFLFQNILNLNFEYCKTISKDNIETIFNEVDVFLQKIYESIMLINLYNYNLTKENKNNIKSNTISFENLCVNYFKEYYKNNLSPSNEQIIKKLNEILKYFQEKLFFSTEMITTLLYQLNGLNINFFSNQFFEQVTSFEKLTLLFQNENEKDLKNKKEIKEEEEDEKTNTKEILTKNFQILKYLITISKIQIPYLPPLDKSKYKYTLVVDLDETLVHYVEEDEKSFVQIRPYADHFLKEMGKYFEIVIFTAAAEDYADIVLKELDKNNFISYKLYRKHTNQNNGVFIKDLSKLGRDIKKVCIIDNNKENFGLQPENGLHISSFLGDQSDNELLNLCQDLMKIINTDLNDIRPVIKEINAIMVNRYIRTNAILE
jgi:CTD small phosphatase-like protein 2